ncbi:AMP-binding protein [Pontibacter sp. BAB1700]|uniref:AMP-binding protein n=1 Tax=Pontibacter sp. BAB1700 TaxID=1144253 RepID=UPI000316CBE2
MRNNTNTTQQARPARLFDCIDWQLQQFPLDDMLASKEDGQWRTYSTQEVKDLVNRISASLLSAGISRNDGSPEGRDKVAIISPNCPEWMLVDMGIQQIGAISVPIYPTISNSELEFILRDAAVKMIFVGNEVLYRKIVGMQDALPELQAIYTFKPVEDAPSWKELLTEPAAHTLQQLEVLRDAIDENDLATILYTSGTTGTPKG